MSEFSATYNDGRTAQAHQIIANFALDAIILRTPSGDELTQWPYRDLTSVNPVVPGQPVLLGYRHQPDARLFIADPAASELVLAKAPHLSARAKTRRILVPMALFAAMVAGIMAAAWFTNFSPSRYIAEAIPKPVRSALGEQVIRSLTRGRPMCTAPAGVAALQKLSQKLMRASAATDRFHIEVARLNRINAFAAPGERVIITRGLLEFVESPEELAGVVAHEIGHGLERHPETALVRAVGLTAVFSFLFGGSEFGSSLGSASSVLVQMRFSREAEREADGHAIRMLNTLGLDPKPFADFFRRLQARKRGKAALAPSDRDRHKPKPSDDAPKRASEAGREPQQETHIFDVLSTHPPTAERIARIEQASRASPASFRSGSILTQAEWQALKAICTDGPDKSNKAQEL